MKPFDTAALFEAVILNAAGVVILNAVKNPRIPLY